MAAFPALTPNDRSYDLGQVPVSEYRGEGNVAIQFRTGSIRVGQRLQLLYVNRPKAEIKQVYDHYQGQQLATFTVPATVWCGHSAGATIADAGLVWRYVERPEPQRNNVNSFTLAVTLEAVGVNIAGTASVSPLEFGESGGLTGAGIDPLPARPEPEPDPPIVAPTITEVASAAAVLPPCLVSAVAPLELRWGTAGLLEPAVVTVGSAVELRWASGGFLEAGVVTAGEPADLSQDP